MVKHIILWQLKDEYSDAEKADIKAGIKAGLEGLAGQIPGLVEIHVNINGLPSSNADLMLATDPDADRVGIAMKCPDGYKNRVCLDYEV